jgi:hypothetical protein
MKSVVVVFTPYKEVIMEIDLTDEGRYLKYLYSKKYVYHIYSVMPFPFT